MVFVVSMSRTGRILPPSFLNLLPFFRNASDTIDTAIGVSFRSADRGVSLLPVLG